MRIVIPWAALAVAGGIAAWARAAEPIPQFDGEVWASPWTDAVRVDGQLAEPAWQQAPAIPVIQGEWATELRFLHDSRNLYVGFICRSRDPKRIVVEYRADGREVWRDDCVELFLDPRHTHQSYMQWCMNAGGYACLVVAGRPDWTAPPGTVVKTALGADRWTLEAAIAWSTLGIGWASGSTLGVAAARHVREAGGKLYLTWGQPRDGPARPHLVMLNPDNTRAVASYFSRLAAEVSRRHADVQSKAGQAPLDAAGRRQLQAVDRRATEAITQAREVLKDFRLRDFSRLGQVEGALLEGLRELRRLEEIIRFLPFFDPPEDCTRPK